MEPNPYRELTLREQLENQLKYAESQAKKLKAAIAFMDANTGAEDFLEQSKKLGR